MPRPHTHTKRIWCWHFLSRMVAASVVLLLDYILQNGTIMFWAKRCPNQNLIVSSRHFQSISGESSLLQILNTIQSVIKAKVTISFRYKVVATQLLSSLSLWNFKGISQVLVAKLLVWLSLLKHTERPCSMKAKDPWSICCICLAPFDTFLSWCIGKGKRGSLFSHLVPLSGELNFHS